jgi:hypothetical protein
MVSFTPDQYLHSILGRYTPTSAERAKAIRAFGHLSSLIRQWANVYLAAIRPSGSFAKGTAIRGATDLDIFVSLKRDTPGSLKDLYYHLDAFLRGNGLGSELRNVSIRVSYSGLSVDIVSGRKQHPLGAAHSLFSRRSDTWLQTNVDLHVQTIKDSPRKRTICLTKIWRQLRGLDFPSFYLELTVIEALKGKLPFRLANNMLTVLNFLAREFPDYRIVDLANTNNVVSDELSDAEKSAISAAAKASLQAADWAHIVW